MPVLGKEFAMMASVCVILATEDSIAASLCKSFLALGIALAMATALEENVVVLQAFQGSTVPKSSLARTTVHFTDFASRVAATVPLLTLAMTALKSRAA